MGKFKNIIFLFFIFIFYANSLCMSIKLTKRQLCDLELILNGGFAPLKGFMCKLDYNNVVENMRLKGGSLWPMPITLDIDEDLAKKIENESVVDLCDAEGIILAKLTVSDVWKPDKKKEAECVFGTTGTDHPGVAYLFEKTKKYYVGGKLEKVASPIHYDFTDLRHTPKELRSIFKQKKVNNVVAFQTRNPMHRVHKEISSRAAKKINGHLLIHPVVGMTKPGDIDYVTRVRCYRKILKYYPKNSVAVSLLPLAMRMAGPREALWHAIIRKNYGCTHFIIGRDHAGPGKNKQGESFYGPYDAQQLAQKYSDEIGIKIVPFKMMAYVKESGEYLPLDEIPKNVKPQFISGTQLRKMIKNGEEIPKWFSYPDIVEELRKTYKRKSEKGFTLFFTGLCASGKSSIAKGVCAKLVEMTSRLVTILDGDIVRQNLSKGLGFSKEDRSINVRRVGFVAKEITKHGGIAICALVSPYKADRNKNRKEIEKYGGYIEAYVSTPLKVCEARDPKGLYKKARSGMIKNFTGIDDPYEPPKNPEIKINTQKFSRKGAVETVINYLKKEKYM
ncbi:bifunctional sulfate adenylyltransferase/adenylylsulfate kinase [Candidatus Dependentiae bacterium]